MTQITRRRVLSTAAGLGAGLAVASKTGANSSNPLPQWGGTSGTTDLQAGPLGLNPALDPGQVPVAIRIPDAGVDAEVEQQQIVDGQMLDPSGPWVVAWYDQTARAGEMGNCVGSGHVDYWDVGPAVFYEVAGLQPGARMDVIGKDGAIYVYEVENIQRVEIASLTVEQLNSAEMVGRTDYPALTLITCGGEFNGEFYTQRDIIRGRLASVEGVQVADAPPAEAPADEPAADEVPEEPAAAPAGGTLAEGAQATVSDDGVNMRSNATTDAEVITVLAAGTVVTITGGSQDANGFTWWPIRLEDGTTGWVVADFLTP
jgi:sortase (surface protein transpeptidase)